jgi:glycosyltransferase involved in cell wall biosynthesis
MSEQETRPPDESPAALRIAFLEGFWGGSHRAVAEGWARSTRHLVCLFHLPARFWKWRMRGAAFAFARQLRAQTGGYDVVFATSTLDLAHLRALLPRRLPTVLFFHENQAAYPAPSGGTPAERDLTYAFTDLAGALAADRVAFNSAYQRDSFFAAMGRLVKRMPDARPTWTLPEIRAKTRVLPLGVHLGDIPPRSARGDEAPLIVWNHRWEYDKDPDTFFRVLQRLADRGIDFRVAVLGEAFRRRPPVFPTARRALGERVCQWGYLPDRAEYLKLLARGDVAVSTARQENFGLSLVEAAFAGAHPLAPRRLSYPEVLPAALHGACLYEDEEDLAARLEGLLTGRLPRVDPDVLRACFARYRWEEQAPVWDDLVAQVFDEEKM